MLVKNRDCRVGVVLAIALCVPFIADAQSLGTRAAGMGEAFVAVADDATSIYWNPAGMATGAYLSFVLDFGSGGAEPGVPDAASRNGSGFIGFTVPPLGLGYYRRSQVVAELRPPEERAPVDREDGRRSVRGLTTSHVGVTVAQSLTEFLIVASTIKLVRGEVTSGFVATGGAADALDAADALPRQSTSQVDVDAGVMVARDRWRGGLVARNLTTPALDRPGAWRELPDAASLRVDNDARH
jgi:hypothetical protein